MTGCLSKEQGVNHTSQVLTSFGRILKHRMRHDVHIQIANEAPTTAKFYFSEYLDVQNRVVVNIISSLYPTLYVLCVKKQLTGMRLETHACNIGSLGHFKIIIFFTVTNKVEHFIYS